MESIKISIIAAVFKEAGNLPGLINSIKSQNYPNVETIVIDGGSKDGTAELLEKLDRDIEFWVSEPDSGIYSAWNRALDHATGDFICFIGADDRWANSHSLADLAKLAANDVDLVTAKFRVHWHGGEHFAEYGEPWSWETLRRNMNVSHRGLLHNARLFKELGRFDETYKIAGDYEFLLRCGRRLRTEFLDEVTVIAGFDGVSFKNPFISLWERYRAQRKHRALAWPVALWTFASDYYQIKAPRVRGRLKRVFARP